MSNIETLGGKGFIASTNYKAPFLVVGGGKICTISPNGEVELGEGVAPEHAAHEFWKALEQLGFSHAQELTEAKSRIAELEAQVEDLGCKLREGGNI